MAPDWQFERGCGAIIAKAGAARQIKSAIRTILRRPECAMRKSFMFVLNFAAGVVIQYQFRRKTGDEIGGR